MARTASTMIPLGTTAPDFALPDTNGQIVSRDSFRGKRGLLVMFICNHCPYVKMLRSELAALGKEYAARDVGIVAIMSNDAENYADDRPEMMVREVAEHKYTFPYLYDETQNVAKAYSASCTPDFFLFDGEFALVYRGQLDGARPGNGVEVTGSDLRAALDALLDGKPPLASQSPSIGCNIKWKPGNAPLAAG